MKIHSYSILLPALLATLATGCNTFDPGEFRDNPSDPKSESFRPDRPTTISVELKNDDIVISWKDNSNYESGYLVEKSLDGLKSFELVDRLSPNTTTYTDESRLIAQTTYYRVATYAKHKDGIWQTVYGNGIPSLQVNPFESLNFHRPNDTTLQISWRLNPLFTDGVLIERKTREEPDYKRIAVIEDPRYGAYKDNISGIETAMLTYRIYSFQHHADSLLVNHMNLWYVEP